MPHILISIAVPAGHDCYDWLMPDPSVHVRDIDGTVLIIGAGDHGRVVLEMLRALEVAPLEMIDPSGEGNPRLVDGCPVIGTLDRAIEWIESRTGLAFVAAIGDNRHRALAFEQALALGLKPIAVIHPHAVVLGGAQVEAGAQICAGAIVGVGASVGANVIVNTAASVDHDVRLNAHAFIAPGARLAGRVTIEEGGFVGMGASVKQGVRVGAWARVGAGALVLEDVEQGRTVVGVPARVVPSTPSRGSA